MRRKGKAKADIMFDPQWWHHHYGIDFGEAYRDNPAYRVQVEQQMKRALFERFGQLGLGEEAPEPVPVISTQNCPLCYLIAEVFGCRVHWESERGPWVEEARLEGRALDRLEFTSIFDAPVMQRLAREMDDLERQYGCVRGDINPQGILNNAYRIRGEALFLDMIDAPERVHRLHGMVCDAMIELGRYFRERTGTTSISVSNIVSQVNPQLYVSSNCMRIMISPDQWETFVLPYEERLGAALEPFGIHDCGPGMEKLASKYIKNTHVEFVEVGWGSDLVRCREILPEPIHLSARYSPVEMRERSVEEIRRQTSELVQAGWPHRYFSTSVVAVDETVSDEKVFAYFQAADEAWTE